MNLGYSDIFESDPSGLLPLAKEGNATTVRWAIDWGSVQKEEGGAFDWSLHEPVYNKARELGLTPAPVIVNSPTWARTNKANVAPPDEAHNTAWEKFVKEFAKKFSPGVVEIWNEPNAEEFWGGPPEPARMADLFNRAYSMINGNDPVHALILSPGLAANATNVKAQAEYFTSFKKGVTAGSEYGAAVHTYALRKCEEGNHVKRCLEELDAFIAVIEGRRLWVTETGFSSGRAGQTGCTATRQAEEHEQNWAGCVNRKVENYSCFRLRDENEGVPPQFENFGVVSAAGKKKAAYTALQKLA